MIDLGSPHKIYEWARGKRNDIERAFRMKGGWEGWLQVELGLELERAGMIVEREQHVFLNSRQATDMVITSPDGTRTILELKCEGVHQDCEERQDGSIVVKNTQGHPHFASRIEADLIKIGLQGENLRDQFKGCWFYCIGFSLTPEALHYVEQQYDNDQLYFMAITPRKLQAAAQTAGLQLTPGVLPTFHSVDMLAMWFKMGYKPR